jgi:endonuclease/exonuclease/phosphatase family metal-dependent hydrolase
MRMVRRLPLVLALAAALYAADTLRVMTFDVRFPLASDGPNTWLARRDMMNAMIRDRQPDLFGAQELFQIQGDYFVEKLTAFAWFGLSRFGNHADEHTGIFYRKSRFEMFDSGNFWLSETPDAPGSVSWNVFVPYMATWGDFLDRRTGRRFRWYNTHFPQRPEDAEARNNCAREIALRVRGLPRSATIILTGDFNADISSEAHTILAGALTDAYQEVAKPSGPTGTLHSFSGKPGADRIDWILYRGALKSVSIQTITFNEHGRYPSDHFPVMAVFGWK